MSRNAKAQSELMSAITQSQQTIGAAARRCVDAASRRASSAAALASVMAITPTFALPVESASEPPPALDTTSECIAAKPPSKG